MRGSRGLAAGGAACGTRGDLRQGERGAAAACSRVPPCPVAPPVAAALLTAHGRTSAGGRARAKAPGSDSRRCPCHLVSLEWWRGAGVGIRPVTHTLRKRAPGLPIALPSRSLRSRSLQFCPAWGSSAPVSLWHCCLTRASTGRSVSQSWKFIASSGSWLRSGQPVEPGVCQPWPAAPLAGCLDHGQVAGAVQAPLQLQDSHPPLAAGEQCARGQGRAGHPGAHFSPPRFSFCPTRPPGAALRAPCVLHAQAPRCFCFPVSCGPSPEVCRGHGGAGRGAETQEGASFAGLEVSVLCGVRPHRSAWPPRHRARVCWSRSPGRNPDAPSQPARPSFCMVNLIWDENRSLR